MSERIRNLLFTFLCFIVACIVIFYCNISNVYAQEFDPPFKSIDEIINNDIVTLASITSAPNFTGYTSYNTNGQYYWMCSGTDYTQNTQTGTFSCSNNVYNWGQDVTEFPLSSGYYYFYRIPLTKASTGVSSVEIYKTIGTNRIYANVIDTYVYTQNSTNYVALKFTVPESFENFSIVIHSTLSSNTGWQRAQILKPSKSIEEMQTDDIINNQDKNKQDIVDNQNKNKQDIVDNQNQNTQDIIDNQKESTNELKDKLNETFGNDCRESTNLIDKNNLDVRPGSYFSSSSGAYATGGNSTAILTYIEVKPSTTYTIYVPGFNKVVFYNSSKSFLSISESTTFTTPSNASYLRIQYATNSSSLDLLQMNLGSSRLPYEPYGQVCNNKLDETNQQLGETNKKLDDLNSSLNNSDSSGASSQAGNFFSGFTTDTHGLTSVITSPLTLIQSITNQSCTPLGLKVPYLENTTINLPCMSTIYEEHFGLFLTIYQTVTFGIIAYWVCIKIFNLVKDFKNPDHDEIEVLDL